MTGLLLLDRDLAFPCVMGVLNVTPDSFSDGGLFVHPEAALRQGIAMAADGAAIVDVGGESTRPGSDPVSVEQEIERPLEPLNVDDKGAVCLSVVGFLVEIEIQWPPRSMIRSSQSD